MKQFDCGLSLRNHFEWSRTCSKRVCIVYIYVFIVEHKAKWGNVTYHGNIHWYHLSFSFAECTCGTYTSSSSPVDEQPVHPSTGRCHSRERRSRREGPPSQQPLLVYIRGPRSVTSHFSFLPFSSHFPPSLLSHFLVVSLGSHSSTQNEAF